jgi:propionyl-CoA synthetase
MSESAEAFCRRSLDDPQGFWAEQAKLIHWERPFDRVLDYDRPPFARWFVGGTTNLCYNAVDRHLHDRADQPAIYFVSTETNQRRTLTYRQLHREVNAFAAVLKSLGLSRGDRAVIYLPMIPEAAIAMLACARLGVIHSVVFAGFAAPSLAGRIDDAEAKVLITADAGTRGGKLVPLKKLADEALRLSAGTVQHQIVVNRGIDASITMQPPRDLDYAALMKAHGGATVPCEWLESTELSYLLYTSGTTARPKGIQRDTGGYAVAMAASVRYLFDGRAGETYFSTADIGWVVGHSYGVYGPLIAGMSTVIYEGIPIGPDPAIWWKIAEETQATVMFSSPTAIRTLKKQDPKYLRQHDLSKLRNLFLAGEPLDQPTSGWIRSELGHVQIIDNYWQTETGWPILSLLPGLGPVKVKPGSPGFPVFGFNPQIVDEVHGEPVPRGQKGVLVLRLPLPPGSMSSVWKHDEIFANHYCNQFPGKPLYSTFDWAVQDEEGYTFILGRTDDVINVAGHRLGTREIEEAICGHPAVAEAAVVGVTDELKGQAINCFVILKQLDGRAPATTTVSEIEAKVVEILGRFARPSFIGIVPALPKTRSGKLLRRAILAVAEGRDPGDITTIEDTTSLDAIRRVLATSPERT